VSVGVAGQALLEFPAPPLDLGLRSVPCLEPQAQLRLQGALGLHEGVIVVLQLRQLHGHLLHLEALRVQPALDLVNLLVALPHLRFEVSAAHLCGVHPALRILLGFLEFLLQLVDLVLRNPQLAIQPVDHLCLFTRLGGLGDL